MGLSKRSLRGLIEYSDLRNNGGLYTEDDVIGVSTDKRMIPTKADLDGVNLLNYKLFPPKSFAYVADTSRRGDRIALAYNNTKRTYIVSTWYVVFQMSDEAEGVLSSDYLFLFFNRSEFDRYTRKNSWGSAREYFWFQDMEEIVIDLPPYPIQQKYVGIYRALITNQKSYECGLEDLRLTIDAQLDRLKKSSRNRPIKALLHEIDNRNKDGAIKNVQGINITKQFMPSVADTNGVNLQNYKVVQTGQFAFSGMQTGRDECIRLALYRGNEPIIVSPAYSVFEANEEVLAEYIMTWFSRAESDRRGWFMSDSSIRTNLDLDRFYEIEIPVPDMKTQKIIAELQAVYVARRDINERLKKQIKDICPILIKGSLEEGKFHEH